MTYDIFSLGISIWFSLGLMKWDMVFFVVDVPNPGENYILFGPLALHSTPVIWKNIVSHFEAILRKLNKTI
jgi:hypothetical protein